MRATPSFCDSSRVEGQLYSSCQKQQQVHTVVAWKFRPSGRAAGGASHHGREKKTGTRRYRGRRCSDSWRRSGAEQARRMRSFRFLEGVGFTGIGRGGNGTESAATPPLRTSNPAVMSSPVPPSRKTLLHLYAASLRASRGFSSYNFRNYFLARTKDAFRGIQVRDS